MDLFFRFIAFDLYELIDSAIMYNFNCESFIFSKHEIQIAFLFSMLFRMNAVQNRWCCPPWTLHSFQSYGCLYFLKHRTFIITIKFHYGFRSDKFANPMWNQCFFSMYRKQQILWFRHQLSGVIQHLSYLNWSKWNNIHPLTTHGTRKWFPRIGRSRSMDRYCVFCFSRP